jgi:aryl-alcohol dehydrogenase-like predicted oxidoreductase
MKQREFGRSGLVVSRLGLGTSTWGTKTTQEADAAAQLEQFLDAGGNLVDTADVYAGGQSERTLGRLLRTIVPQRSDVILSTKSGAISNKPPPRVDASRAHLLSALDASLERLQTDHVDLWHIHWWDPETSLDETLEAMDFAVSSGRVRHVGVSNYSGWQLAKATACQSSREAAPIVSCQVEYSLLERGIERDVVPAASDSGVGVLPWAPLGRGVLTGKYRAGVPADKANSGFFNWYVKYRLDNEKTAAIVETLAEAAQAIGASPLTVALAWVRDRPAVVAPIVGARTAEQLRESLTAETLELPQAVRQRLDDVSGGSDLVPPLELETRIVAARVAVRSAPTESILR